MAENKTSSTDAFRALIDVAEGEIASVISGLPAKGSPSLLQVCRDHLETITWAAEMGDLAHLFTAASAIHTHYSDDLSGLTPKKGEVFISWLDTVRAHLENPDDAGILKSLLQPLPVKLRASVTFEDLGVAGNKPTSGIETIPDLESYAESVPSSAMDPIALGDFEAAEDATDPLDDDEFTDEMDVASEIERLSSSAGIDDGDLVADTEGDFDTVADHAQLANDKGTDDADSHADASLINDDNDTEKFSTVTAAAALTEDNAVDDLESFAAAETQADSNSINDPDIIDDSEQPDASDQDLDIPNTYDLSVFDDDDEEDFDTNNMLGMLASELHQAIPRLNELVEAIAICEDSADLAQAVESYHEFVARIYQVSRDLGLRGLVLICDFVTHNVTQLATLPISERHDRLAIICGWPQVIIAHLVAPLDDGLCLDVIDYLENEGWPAPLPYREVRDLIEGLATGPEVSGNEEVELRQTEATAEDVALVISADVSQELKDAFFDESPGHAEVFSHLVEAISSGDNIQQNVESAQRIAHTLKGSGNLVGATGVATLSHHIEDIFEYIAAHKMTPPRALAYTMQEAADTIESMLEYLQGIAPPPDDAQRVLQDVLNWANRIDKGNLRRDDFNEQEPASMRAVRMKAEAEFHPGAISDRRMQADQAAAVTTVEQQSDDKVNHENPTQEGQANAATLKTEAVRVPINVLDNIFRIVSETAIAIGQIQEHLGRLDNGDKLIRSNDSSLQLRRYELENLVSIRGMAAQHRHDSADSSSAFDPLEMDEYDEFYGATHAYIEGVADSRHILREFTSEVSELNSLFLLQQRLNKELQEVVMTTRMIPASSITARLHRTVRQACRMTGKLAELEITGDDLLLDGDVLNRLANPLMHVLRNAVDHGIENTEQRYESGKPEVGNILLRFRQEGNSVLVECIDDGKGLDYERIREIAISRGLMAQDDNLGNDALARMILRSGFSTRETLTQVSGRGVGMDIVHNTIQSLKGSMEVNDAPDGGTLVALRLPITLLTSHCLLADIGDNNLFAIPTSSLKQILSPGIGELKKVSNGMTYQLGLDVYAAHSLSSLLGVADETQSENIDKSRILLVQTTNGVKAVTVKHVVSSYDLVLKNMGAYVKSLHGVAGVSILGSGSVVAVLDLASLLQNQKELGVTEISTKTSTPVVAELALPKVLVVDDSLSVRSSLSQLMTDGGYQVVTARDGLEAVNMLEDEQPDIILTDLEMPRMNGLDLVGYIRNSVLWSPLPVVMITSRTMAKHRQQAESVGVNCYITKPFTEDEVLASIDEQLAQPSAI